MRGGALGLPPLIQRGLPGEDENGPRRATEGSAAARLARCLQIRLLGRAAGVGGWGRRPARPDEAGYSRQAAHHNARCGRILTRANLHQSEEARPDKPNGNVV